MDFGFKPPEEAATTAQTNEEKEFGFSSVSQDHSDQKTPVDENSTQEKPQLKNIEDVHEKLDELDEAIRKGDWEKAQKIIDSLNLFLDKKEESNIPPQTRKYLSAQLSSIKKEK